MHENVDRDDADRQYTTMIVEKTRTNMKVLLLNFWVFVSSAIVSFQGVCGFSWGLDWSLVWSSAKKNRLFLAFAVLHRVKG